VSRYQRRGWTGPGVAGGPGPRGAAEPGPREPGTAGRSRLRSSRDPSQGPSQPESIWPGPSGPHVSPEASHASRHDGPMAPNRTPITTHPISLPGRSPLPRSRPRPRPAIPAPYTLESPPVPQGHQAFPGDLPLAPSHHRAFPLDPPSSRAAIKRCPANLRTTRCTIRSSPSIPPRPVPPSRVPNQLWTAFRGRELGQSRMPLKHRQRPPCPLA